MREDELEVTAKQTGAETSPARSAVPQYPNKKSRAGPLRVTSWQICGNEVGPRSGPESQVRARPARRVSQQPVITQEVCSDEAGLRSSHKVISVKGRA